MEKETIVIDGVRYYADRPKSCRGCFFWRTEKQGVLSKRRTATTWPSLRKRNRPVTAAATAPASASA